MHTIFHYSLFIFLGFPRKWCSKTHERLFWNYFSADLPCGFRLPCVFEQIILQYHRDNSIVQVTDRMSDWACSSLRNIGMCFSDWFIDPQPIITLVGRQSKLADIRGSSAKKWETIRVASTLTPVISPSD